jgi:hypothetical protein
MGKEKLKSTNSTINIHECLKMIGMKELTANIYTLPTKNKKTKETA